MGVFVSLHPWSFLLNIINPSLHLPPSEPSIETHSHHIINYWHQLQRYTFQREPILWSTLTVNDNASFSLVLVQLEFDAAKFLAVEQIEIARNFAISILSWRHLTNSVEWYSIFTLSCPSWIHACSTTASRICVPMVAGRDGKIVPFWTVLEVI